MRGSSATKLLRSEEQTESLLVLTLLFNHDIKCSLSPCLSSPQTLQLLLPGRPVLPEDLGGGPGVIAGDGVLAPPRPVSDIRKEVVLSYLVLLVLYE